MILHLEHLEKASLVSRVNVILPNSTNTTLLIRLYKIFVRRCRDYTFAALTALNKTQRQRLQVIENRCLRFARGTVDSICISHDELSSRCSIVSAEQRIFAIANKGW